MIPADGGGRSGGTNFRGMDHQQMIAWLDEASSFSVGEAAGVLRSAASDLQAIADRLKKRMDGMDWEGEAEKAFVEWALSVVSSTRALAKYSDDGAYWMDNNAEAIAAATSAMPRYTSHESAKANLEAALKYHNDPDAQTIARNARSQMATTDGLSAQKQLEAIQAQERANQQAAAAEMERLSGTYDWSSRQMANLEKPTFPPPPGTFVPSRETGVNDSTYNGSNQQSSDRYSSTETPRQPARPQETTPPTRDQYVVPPLPDQDGPTQVVRPETPRTDVRPEQPVDLGIDSVGTLPPPTTTGPAPTTPGQPPMPTGPTTATPPFVPGPVVPPMTGKGGGPGMPPLPTTGPVTGTARGGGQPALPRVGQPGLPGMRDGITGGRPVATTGPTTGLPRTNVIGHESGRGTTGVGRGPMGGPLGGPLGGGVAGQNAISGGRRIATEPGGVVGGRPQQRPGGAAAGRPFTPGGSGLVGRGPTTPQGERREEKNGERPDYLVEDEETWQQGNRRTAPPVID